MYIGADDRGFHGSQPPAEELEEIREKKRREYEPLQLMKSSTHKSHFLQI